MNVGASLFILWAQNAGVSVFSCHNMNEMWRLFILCPAVLWPVVKTQKRRIFGWAKAKTAIGATKARILWLGKGKPDRKEADRGRAKRKKSDRKPLLAKKVTGLQKLGVEVVEEGGEEGVGEAEAVLPAVVPPAGGLDPEGVEEGSVFLVLIGRMEDLGEDAVDQGGVCLDGGEYRRVKAQVADADRVEDVGETVHVFAPEDSVEPGPVDLVAVVLDEKEPVEELAQVNVD